MRYLAALVWIVAVGCACRDHPSLLNERVEARWFSARMEPARGVFVVVHGLNQRPSTMDPLSDYLASLGFHTYRVSLEGHDQNRDIVFPADVWTKDVIRGVLETKERHPSLPLYILGYSMGGLLTVQAIESSPEVSPKKVILVAPALSLRTLVLSAKLLTLFPPLSLRTPNLAPSKYRRSAATPLFWYSNIAELYDAAQDPPDPERLRAVEALVLLNPEDELISESGTEEWLGEHGLSQAWRVERVTPQPTEPDMREHIIIDQPSLGDTEWLRMRALVRSFLEQ